MRLARGVFCARLLLLGAVVGATGAQGQGRSAFTPSAPAPAPTLEAAPAPAPARPKPTASATPSPAPAAAPAAAPENEAPAPYEPQLLRLGEMMGALSYLRDLCRDGDGGEFRDRFARLMQVETHSAERQDALAGAFNRGFGDYQLTYRACTDAARETIARYLEETQRIARDVATRYGG